MNALVRLPYRVRLHLTGTGWWQGERYDGTAAGDRLAQEVKAAIVAARKNADGSVSLRPSDPEAAFLREQADNLAAVARDDAGWDTDARADLNSARAFVRRLDQRSRR